MKKRILSIVLAVLMLLSVLPVSVLAATEPEQPRSNITATKKAEWVNETEGIARVTIEVSGKKPEEMVVTDPTDIVLVIDRSLSMDDKATSNDRDDKMTQAKNAAKQFAQKMLESDKVRIAVVMYTKTAQTVKGQNQDAFSNKYATVESRINSITTSDVPSNNSGTNIQAGIHEARELLNNSKATNKIMIVLSDGQPNYSFRFVANADYVGCERRTNRRCNNFGMTGGSVQKRGDFTVDYEDFVIEKDWYNNATFDLQNGNAIVKITCKKHGTTKYDYGVYNGSTYNGNTLNTDHSVATIWEAGQAKNKGVEIYSIGFGIGNNQNAIKTMRGIASAKTEDHYFSAGMSANDIKAVFESIAKQVSKYVAYDPIVIDTISNDFDYYTDDDHQPTTSDAKDTVSPSGKTVTWDLAAEQLDTTKHTLTFYVKYKNIDNPAAPKTELPTNASAQLKYAKEENGQATETQNIANASVLSLSKTVSYEVTGKAPKDYMKPGNAYVWVGHEYTVADVPGTVDAEEGTYTFEGWKANGKTVGGKLPITADITLTGKWTFEAAPTMKTLTVTKTWDGLAATAEKPTVTFKLTQKKNDAPTNYTKTFTLDGMVDTGSEVVETAPWTATIEVPVKDTDGTEFDYDVVETMIGELSVTVQSGYNYITKKNTDGSDYVVSKWHIGFEKRLSEGEYSFTNTYEEAKHDYKVEYQFVGTDKPDDVTSAPDAVTGLYAGQQIALEQVLTSQAGWTFDGWYEKQEDIGNAAKKLSGLYEVTKDATLYGKWTYQAPQPETIDITVTKEWVNADGEYDKKPVEIELYKNGVATGTKLTLNGTEQPTAWTGTFENLSDDGVYSVKETRIGGWSFGADNKATIDHVSTYRYEVTGDAAGGFTVTNTLEKRTWSVTKTVDKTACKVGDMLTYTITVMNDGNVALNNIDVRESFGGKGKLYWDANRENEVTLGEKNSLGTIKTLKTGDSETYILYYWVEEADGESVTNTVWTAIDEVYSNSTVTTDVDRGDVDGYKVTGWIMKTVESKKGTFKKNATFTFNICADEAGKDVLKTVYITKDWNVTKDEGDSKTKPFDFQISKNDFEKLDGVVYVTEVPGDIKGMTYDSKVVTMYLREPRVVVNSYEATTNLILDEAAPAEFTNVYKKPADKGETIKSGPQLNRDDHVAYIMGYPDGTVQPEGEITRAEACTIFFRLLTDSSRDYYFARTNDYSDVNRGDWFNNAISTLSNAGIVTGYNDGTFRPNQPITRGEMAKIIANFANLKYGGKTFTDLAGHWSKSYVELAAGNGWIAGYPDGSFRPDQKITRAETVTMINRVLDRVPAKESRLLSRSIMLTFPDNKPGDWYYIAIQEASNSHEYQRSVYETTGDEMWTKLIDNVDWTKLEK